MKIIEIYEYGNGIYAEPFWDRVQKKIDKVEEEYEIINMDKKFIKFGEILFGFFKQKLSGKISRQQGLVIFEIPTWRPLEIKCYARR